MLDRSEVENRGHRSIKRHRSASSGDENLANRRRRLNEDAPTESVRVVRRVDQLVGADYKASVLEYYYAKSAEHPLANGRSPAHGKYRGELVDWMTEACEEFGFQELTLHLGVRLLDRVLLEVNLHRGDLLCLANTCLNIGAKFHEAADDVPPLEDLVLYSGNRMSAREMITMELRVLGTVEYGVRSVTVAHFVHHYAEEGVVYLNDSHPDRGFDADRRELNEYMVKYCKFFAKLSLHNYALQRFPPAVLAAACVASSRLALKFGAVWRKELNDLFRIKDSSDERMFLRCFDALYAFYNETFPARVTKAELGRSSPDSISQLM